MALIGLSNPPLQEAQQLTRDFHQRLPRKFLRITKIKIGGHALFFLSRYSYSGFFAPPAIRLLSYFRYKNKWFA